MNFAISFSISKKKKNSLNWDFIEFIGNNIGENRYLYIL